METKRDREFQELSNNMRHWERMRWVSMAVFIAIMGGSLTGLFTWRQALEPVHYRLIKVLGLFLVVIFWVQDERIVAYWKATKRRAHEIEKEEGIQVFSITPRRGLFSAGTAVRVLYFLFFSVWITLLAT